jgi:hypothetical protein
MKLKNKMEDGGGGEALIPQGRCQVVRVMLTEFRPVLSHSPNFDCVNISPRVCGIEIRRGWNNELCGCQYKESSSTSP